ncbi:lytic transglycosylase domain-containing protein [Jatrophihabitans sp. YIM 134969]
MPTAVPLPEFVTSRRHRVSGLAGLAVIAALAGAATFAPGPSAARPVAQAPSTVTPQPVAVAAPLLGSAADDALDLPGDVSTNPHATRTPTPGATAAPSGPAVTALAAQGIPIVALEAYREAAALQAATRPSCHLAWTLVAAIGAVESGHGTHAGARLYADGQDLPHVIGPVLDGTDGNARIADTDGGRLDGDKTFDRAVGPMQFIPSTWALRGLDGNGDGKADPFNIVDAAATTGDYLCRYDQDLRTDAGRRVAVFGYNHLDSYVATVLALDAAYAHRPVTTTSPSPAAPPAVSPTPSGTPSAPRPAATPTRAGTPTTTPTTTRPTTPAPTTTTTTPTCPTPSPTSTTSPSSSATSTGTATPVPSGCPTPTASTSAATTTVAPTSSVVPSADADPSVAPSPGA